MASPQTRYAVTQRVCSLNNCGVKSLNLGEMSRALDYFAEAIETAKELVLFSQDGQQQKYNNDDLEPAIIGYWFSYSSCEKRLEGRKKRDDAVSICDRALKIALVGPCSSAHSQPISFLFSLILFNMALLHHTVGLLYARSSALEKAKTIYERCILIATAEDMQATAQHNDGNGRLILGCAINNLAQLAMECGNIEVARQYLKQLETVYRSLLFASNDIHRNERMSILTNVLMRGGLNAARAA